MSSWLSGARSLWSRRTRARVRGRAGLRGWAGLRGGLRLLSRGRRGAAELGSATAEYAITTLAAVGFAGLLLGILRSAEIRGVLLGLVRRALSIG